MDVNKQMDILDEVMEIHLDVTMIGEDYFKREFELSAPQKKQYLTTVTEEVDLFEKLWQSTSYDLEEEFEELIEIKEYLSLSVL